MTSATTVTISAERLATLERLADRQDILDCLTRALRGIDRYDRELFLSAFHPDAVMDAGGYVAAPDQVYDGVSVLHEEGQSSTQHNLLNHSCEIEGDVAHTETYLLFIGRNRDDTNWITGGRYLDRFERRDGAWRIAFRYTLIEWSGIIPPSNVPLFDNIADLHANGVPSRSKEDPSYRRPLANRRGLRAPATVAGLGDPRR